MSTEHERPKSKRPFQFITGKIRNKLFVILLATAMGTLLVAIAAFFSMKVSQETIDEIVNVENQVVNLANTAKSEVVQAQVQDQSYFLNYKKMGLENARTQYVDKVESHINASVAAVTQIQEILADNEVVVAQINEVQRKAKIYNDKFQQVVELNEYLGYKGFGLLTDLDRFMHELEKLLKGHPEFSLMSLVRSEKDYLIQDSRTGMRDIYGQLETLEKGVEQSSLGAKVKNESLILIKAYRITFRDITTTMKESAVLQRGYRSAVKGILPDLTTIAETVSFQRDAAITKMNDTNEIAQIVVWAVTGVTLLLGFFSAIFFSGRLTRQVDNIMNVFKDIDKGDYNSRAKIVSHDELGAMAESLNAVLDNTLVLIQSRDERDSIQQSIMNLLTEISDLADGDLTVRAEVTEEITGAIADSFNSMAEELSRVVRGVKAASTQVGESSQDVDVVTKKLSEYSETQSAKVAEAIRTIQEMADTIKLVSNKANESAQVSESARVSAQEGSESVKKTNDAMARIKENMKGTSRTIKRLSESSQEIGNIVQLIQDITDRTSILALNASIQASMAGDAGRGFAVVAEEVQRLAERSAESTKQIEGLIASIQNEISVAGVSMETSIQHVVEGTELADQAYGKLGEIEDVSGNLAEIIHSISVTAQQQAIDSESITAMMEEVGVLTDKATSMTRETTDSMGKITSTSEQLEKSIAIFKIEETTGQQYEI